MRRKRHCRAMDGPSMPAPRSNDGAKEPGATRRDGLRGKFFWFLLAGRPSGRLPKETRPGGRNPNDTEISPTSKSQANSIGITTSSPAAKRVESVANGAFGGRVQRLVLSQLVRLMFLGSVRKVQTGRIGAMTGW